MHRRLLGAGAVDAGVVLPGRYLDDGDPASGRVRNQDALIDHARRLASRLDQLLDAEQSPLMLGGDCSLLLGAGLALARRGRHGLVHIDGHTDFRHPGNNDVCLSVADEDLAAAVGRHWPALADLDRYRPYFAPEDAVHLGCRDDDEHLAEAQHVLGAVLPTSRIQQAGIQAAVRAAEAIVIGPGLRGYWLHVDVDVLDPDHLPAVDSPNPGGMHPDQLTELLQALAPGALGAQITVFDPDLDPHGRYANMLTDVLDHGLRQLGTNQEHR